MRRILLAVITLVAVLLAAAVVTMRGGETANALRTNCPDPTTITSTAVRDAVTVGQRLEGPAASAPVCPGGPSAAALYAARDAIECRDPVTMWRIDWRRGVVVVTLKGSTVPDAVAFADERGIDPDLLAFTPPTGFRKLASCLPE